MINNRIEDQTLSTLCERVGVAFEVGLDPHRVFDREGESPRRMYAAKMRSIAEHVRKGTSLADAIRAQGNYFPTYFADMIEGGESTGRLDRVLDRSAEYYQQSAEFRSVFRNSILWPIVQMLLAVLIISGLIYLPEVLIPENPPDLLGLGLVGFGGMITFWICVGIAGAAIFSVYWLIRNGYLSFFSDVFSKMPWIGRTTRVFPEARFVQSLALGVEAGLDASNAMNLAFRAAGTRSYQARAEPADAAIRQGREMHDVMDETGLFQRDTVEVVDLGERSGRLAELLDKHYRLLKIEVKSAMAKITYAASALIWVVISVALILIIVRVFSMYANSLDQDRMGAGFANSAIDTMPKTPSP